MRDYSGGRRRLRRKLSLRTGLLAVMASTALLTAACGGSADSPQVASLGSSGASGSGSSTSSGGGSGSPDTGSSATNLPKGSPTQLLNEWAGCMRRNGDPGQADPTIDAGKVIHVVMLPSVQGGLYGQDGQSSSGPGTHCGEYLTAASTALRDGQPLPSSPGQAALVKYAECMRANGVADFPDPTAAGFELPGGPGSDQNNPALQNAAKVCVKKTGVDPAGGGGPLPPGSFVVGPPGGPGAPLVPVSGGNGGPGANG